ncbi:MAG: hypothetical protein Q9187_005660 [Circinaria calcarea]
MVENMIQKEKSVASTKKKERLEFPEDKSKDVCYFAKDILEALGECDGVPGTLNAVTTQPGVLAFVILYPSKPEQNDRRSNTVYACTNLNLLLDADGTGSFKFNSPADFLWLRRVCISKVVFPVFAFRKYRHRWNFSSTYRYLGQRRISSVRYLAPGAREQQQGIEPMVEAQNGWMELLLQEVPDTREDHPTRHVVGTPVSVVDSIIKDLRASKMQELNALWQANPGMRKVWKGRSGHGKFKDERSSRERIEEETGDKNECIERKGNGVKSMNGEEPTEKSGCISSTYDYDINDDELLLIDLNDMKEEARTEGQLPECFTTGGRLRSRIMKGVGCGASRRELETQRDILSEDLIPFGQDNKFCEEGVKYSSNTANAETRQLTESSSAKWMALSEKKRCMPLIDLSDSSQEGVFFSDDDSEDNNSQEAHLQDRRLSNEGEPKWNHVWYFRPPTAPEPDKIYSKTLDDTKLPGDEHKLPYDKKFPRKKLKHVAQTAPIVATSAEPIPQEAQSISKSIPQNSPSVAVNTGARRQRYGAPTLKLSRAKQIKEWKKQLWGMDSDSEGGSPDGADEEAKKTPVWMGDEMDTEEQIEQSLWFRAGCKQTKRGDVLRQWDRKWEVIPAEIEEKQGQRKVIRPSHPRRRNRKDSKPY